MIFALVDYLQYRFKIGPYGDNQVSGLGALAFFNRIPESVIAELSPADVIFTQRLDSALSWAAMYFGSSPVDHMGIYTGKGTVIHTTLGGVKEHSLKVLAKNARILIVKDMGSVVRGMEESPAGGVLMAQTRWYHSFPPKIQLAWVGVEIVLGFYPASFRGRFFADVVITCAAIDAAIYSLLHTVVALPIAFVLGCIIAFNFLVHAYRRWKGKPFPLLSHPDLGYRNFFRNGGRMVTRVGTLVVSDFGLLPLNTFLALREKLGLSGQGSDDGADNDL